MKSFLFGCLTIIALSGSAMAQVTAPANHDSVVAARANDIPFDVTACHTERIGPGQVRSGNGDLGDTIIAKLGKEEALAYFKRHLNDNRSATFYALIGIHRAGGEYELDMAMLKAGDEEILFQKGCLMMKKPLREAVFIAINDR